MQRSMATDISRINLGPTGDEQLRHLRTRMCCHMKRRTGRTPTATHTIYIGAGLVGRMDIRAMGNQQPCKSHPSAGSRAVQKRATSSISRVDIRTAPKQPLRTFVVPHQGGPPQGLFG